MSADRSVLLTPRLQAGKVAFRELVDAFGGQVAAAVETGKSQPRISAYGLRNTDDFAPVDVVLRLEQGLLDRASGGCAQRGAHGSHNSRSTHPPDERLRSFPQVTRWLARQTGFALVALPDPDAASTGKWGLLASRLARQSGELVGGICANLADDNDVSPPEAKARIDAASENVRIAVELEHALRVRALERETGGG